MLIWLDYIPSFLIQIGSTDIYELIWFPISIVLAGHSDCFLYGSIHLNKYMIVTTLLDQSVRLWYISGKMDGCDSRWLFMV
jgi:hypothetical protein